MMFGKCCENFSIKLYVAGVQRVNKFAVCDAVYAGSRVYFYAPQGASYAFFLAVVVKTMNTRMQQRFTRLAFF